MSQSEIVRGRTNSRYINTIINRLDISDKIIFMGCKHKNSSKANVSVLKAVYAASSLMLCPCHVSEILNLFPSSNTNDTNDTNVVVLELVLLQRPVHVSFMCLICFAQEIWNLIWHFVEFQTCSCINLLFMKIRQKCIF